MNAATQKRLLDALLEKEPAKSGDVFERGLYVAAVKQDIATLAPVIDQLIREREAELMKPMICGHPVAELELAPLESQPAEAVISNQGHTFELIDAKKAAYICAGCRRQQEFVRELTTHVKKLFTREGPFAPIPEDVDRVITQLVEGPKPPVRAA